MVGRLVQPAARLPFEKLSDATSELLAISRDEFYYHARCKTWGCASQHGFDSPGATDRAARKTSGTKCAILLRVHNVAAANDTSHLNRARGSDLRETHQ